MKKIYTIGEIKKCQEKVSGLKSSFGVIKFDKSKCKLGIPQTLKNVNCWSTKNSETNLSDSLTITSFTVSSSNETTAPVIAEVTAVTTPTNDIHISLLKYSSTLFPFRY